MKAEESAIPDDGIRSRQRQLAGDLRALILSGDLAPGARLPSTAELTRRYNVNNMSVTRALAVLKAEGLVDGQKGREVFSTSRRPTVVRAGHYPVAPQSGQPYPWITEAASRNRVGSSELIEVSERPAPVQVAAAFGLAPAEPVVMRHQLLLLDAEPAELVWSYYPVAVARGTALAERRLIKGGSPAALAALGLPPRRAVDQVATRFATVAEFIALTLPADIPVLRQFRVVYTDDDRPVEASVMIKAGQQYEVQYELPGGPQPGQPGVPEQCFT